MPQLLYLSISRKEFKAIQQLAARKKFRVSTLVRSWVLQRLEEEMTGIVR